MAGASSQEELVARVLEMAASPTAFGVWMLVVASMRALSVFLGYCAPSQLHGKVFAVDAARFKQGVGGIQFTALTGRTFAVWTAVTCIVCLAAAARPADTPTLHLAAATFLVADAFFFAELLVYRTATIGSIAAPFVFASAFVGGGGGGRGGGGWGRGGAARGGGT